MTQTQLLKGAIYEMGLLFNQQPGEDKINAYAKALKAFTPDQVKYAFTEVIKSGSAFFPSLAEILKHLRPQEVSSDDIANMVVTEIVAKCIHHGQYRLAKVKEELSEIARTVVEMNPGILMDVCNSTENTLPTIKAQLRGFVRAIVESQRASRKNDKLEALGIDTSKVLKINEDQPKLRALDFSGFKENA